MSRIPYSNPARPYDLTKPEELTRLLHEVLGYLHVCADCGADTRGRDYARNALYELIVSGDVARNAEIVSRGIPMAGERRGFVVLDVVAGEYVKSVDVTNQVVITTGNLTEAKVYCPESWMGLYGPKYRTIPGFVQPVAARE